MFEKEIKFIIDFTLNRIKKLGSNFTYDKLTSADLHPAIILYISAELDYLIYEDRKRLLQNSAFDYSGSEISKYFKLIAGEIKKNKRLAFEDIKTLVTHAVTFNINFLVRPNWTLSKLIFSEEKTRNVNEIKMMLGYLYYYDYVKNVFQGYFSKRRILSLSETEFDMILEKIDRQMFSEHTNDLIDNALVSISDFFNEGGVNKTQIASQNVEMFLKEKNLMEALFKLRRSIPSDDKRNYDIEDIRRILYSNEPVKIEPETEEKKEAAEEQIKKRTKEEKEEVVEERLKKGTKEEKEEAAEEQLKRETNEEKEQPEDQTEEEPEEQFEEESEEESIDWISAAGDIEEEIVIQDSETPDKLEENLKISRSITDEEISIEGIEDIEEEKAEPEEDDEFLKKYESELKSLEDLEAQLRHLGVEENLSPDEPFGVPEIKADEAEEEPAEEETNETEHIKPVESELEDDFDIEDSEDSDKMIIEEEEVDPYDASNKDRKEEKPEPAPRRPKDILSFLSDKAMDKIVSNVFNEDEEDFANTMEKISESPGYDEATEILKSVFFSYKVSPYSKDAVSLTNAVSNYFDQDG